MNQVTLLGNLTYDITFYQNNNPVAKTGIAVLNRRNNTTMFINLVFFGKLAEIADQYLKRGSKVCVHGRLDLNQWEKNGKKLQSHSVIVQELEMLSPSTKHTQYTQNTQNTPKKQDTQDTSNTDHYEPTSFFTPDINIDINEDEIPF